MNDSDRITWIGTEAAGLYRYQEKCRAHFEKGGGLLSGPIRTPYVDVQSTLWIGTASRGHLNERL